MDVVDKDKLEAEKRNVGSVSNHTLSLPSDWPCGGADFANLSMHLISPASSLSSMVDSYVASVWESTPTNSYPLGFSGTNPPPGVGWQEPNSLLKSGLLSPTAAAEFAYFNPGNVADLMHSFAMNQPVSPYNQLIAPMPYGPHAVLMDTTMDVSDHRKQERIPMTYNTRYIDGAKQAKSDESDSGHNGCQEDIGTEPSLSKGFGAKKRKRGGKDAELELPQQLSGRDDTDNSKQNSPLKQCSEASDPPKEEYIHVRARRGQATNSHSLAERVRREKIRERMKLLQDLVPGCSKVTGKAVMLDEIINYVQSLQRQVEFLSMKLATVDPRKDFNIAGLLAKDQMFGRRAAPSSLGLSPVLPMAYPLMNPSQQSLLPFVGSSSDALRNLNYELPSLHEGYKEHTQQMPNVWNDELQNVVQMGFSPSAALDNQETQKNSSLPAGHMKVEL